MKTLLRFLKLFVAFFFVLVGGYWAWLSNHMPSIVNKDKPTLIFAALVCVGLTILWTDWTATRR